MGKFEFLRSLPLPSQLDGCSGRKKKKKMMGEEAKPEEEDPNKVDPEEEEENKEAEKEEGEEEDKPFSKAKAGEGGRFKACVASGKTPALCASIGQKKFGKGKFQKMAAKGRKDSKFGFINKLGDTKEEDQRKVSQQQFIQIFQKEWEDNDILTAFRRTIQNLTGITLTTPYAWQTQLQGQLDSDEEPLSFNDFFDFRVGEGRDVMDAYEIAARDYYALPVSAQVSMAHAVDDKSSCFKMDNVTETETEYIVPIILTKAMVQPYPEKKMKMAKLPDNLKNARFVDYKTGKPTERIPLFEHHPRHEVPSLEVGYIEQLKYDEKNTRIVGKGHIYKKRISENLDGYFKKREAIGTSIGFMYTDGPGGEFNGEKYDAAQENIAITHTALLAPNEAEGRCPLGYCGVGISKTCATA
jgi:hypothetical protein